MEDRISVLQLFRPISIFPQEYRVKCTIIYRNAVIRIVFCLSHNFSVGNDFRDHVAHPSQKFQWTDPTPHSLATLVLNPMLSPVVINIWFTFNLLQDTPNLDLINIKLLRNSLSCFAQLLKSNMYCPLCILSKQY